MRNLRSFKDADGFDIVILLQHYLYYLRLLSWNDLSDKIRLDRQFAMLAPTIDQDCQLYLSRAAKVHKLIESGSDGPTCIKDVVDQNYDLALYIRVELGPVHDRIRSDGREVIAIERDVDDPVLRTFAFDRLDLVDYPLGERYTSPPDPYNVQILCTMIFLNDLRREARQCTFHPRAVHYSGFFDQVKFVSHSRANRNKERREVQRLNSLSFKYRTASFNIYGLAMAGIYENIFRPMMFGLDAETAHEIGIESLRLGLSSEFAQRIASQRFGSQGFEDIERFGLRFANPLGIAAGFDKNGVAVNQLAALGFGFVEVGTVTYRPQKGNEKPRMFRLPADKALINRLGFNNDGADAVAARLRKLDKRCVVGVNIGKNKDISNDAAVENYLASFELVYEVADYIAVNISSPNTPNLRELQQGENLEVLLKSLQDRNRVLSPGFSPQISEEEGRAQRAKPLLVKIAPDLKESDIEVIVDICLRHGIAGIIATNTTVSRRSLRTRQIEKFGAGGLSGRPLADRSNEVITQIFRHSKGKLPVVGVGGIFTADDAFEKIAAGASLLQAYTGFVYAGPAFARTVNDGLLKILKEKGFARIDDAVGTAVRHGTGSA